MLNITGRQFVRLLTTQIDFLTILTSPFIITTPRSRKDEYSDPRGTFLQFGAIDDGPTAVHMLEG
jgi:hypothetical protein